MSLERAKVGLVALVLGLGLAAPACTPLDDATVAYQRGDYATALRLFRPLAEQGDAAAQNYLGIMYATGRGVPRDDAEAVRWYRKAAEQGFTPAQRNLGIMYA